jgi:hypothetical protein
MKKQFFGRMIRQSSPQSFRRRWESAGTIHANSAKQKIMRTLLRHIPTGRYFQSLEKWTVKPQKAHDFRFAERALRFVAATGFRDMELVLTLKTTPKSV